MSIAYSTEHQNSNYASTTLAQSMDGRPGDYQNPHQQGQQGAQTAYADIGVSGSDHFSETSSADHTSQHQYSQGPDVKFNPAATPTSEYLSTPGSRPGSQFPEYHLQPQQQQQHARAQYPDGSHRYPQNGTPGGAQAHMAHPTSPSLQNPHDVPLHEGRPNATNANSDMPIPIDPSIAASSPTYPPQHHYSPYGPAGHHEIPHYQHPHGMYRPEYGSPYGAPHHGVPSPYGHMPQPYQGGHPMSTVYSFVPIPGTQQQKRPRRRYEEIERMYKCGWNGCEKAYGTLNHLNAHVTMQSHGTKRTPEEFKEIRKEWKARKKEEETSRKAEEERQRQASQQSGGHPEGQNQTDGSAQAPPGNYQQGVRQLPPLGYAPASGQVAAQYGPPNGGMEGMPPQYANGQMPAYGYPPSPYAQQGQMYSNSHSATPGQQESGPSDK